MKLSKEKILQFITSPVTVCLYDSVDSTNNEAKRTFDRERGICLYAASRQTAGRGRHGHSFYSPKDTGLYMTLTLPLRDTADIQLITCAAAVAVCQAVTALSDTEPRIKWVNDILVDGKKAAGILTELLTDSKNQPQAVIVGIGLNLCTEDFPDEFAENAGNLGKIDPSALCGTIANNLIKTINDVDNNSVIEKYKPLNLCIGREITYQINGVAHTAEAVDIAPDGSLIVEENGGISHLHSGEISVTF